MSLYIGKTISLISTKKIRYVGLLKNIDAEQSTVALVSVRCFGTEGRNAGTDQPEVPPNPNVFDHVVFRGSDVVDLAVLDDPVDQVQPQATAQHNVAPTSTQNEPAANAPARPTGVARPPAASPGQAPAQPRETGAPQPQHVAPTPTTTKPTATTTKESAPGTAPRPRAPKEEARPQPGPRPKEAYSTAFDFDEANARFEKEKVESKPGYDKKLSFFDNISSSTGKPNGMFWKDEKTLNLDTFGEASVRGNRRSKGRGRGNWRGRGNRGRGKPEPKPEWA